MANAYFRKTAEVVVSSTGAYLTANAAGAFIRDVPHHPFLNTAPDKINGLEEATAALLFAAATVLLAKNAAKSFTFG